MSAKSTLCVFGYAAAAVVILSLTQVSAIEYAVALLGAVPIGFYCSRLDAEGR